MSRYLISYPNNGVRQYCGENKSVISRERRFLARKDCNVDRNAEVAGTCTVSEENLKLTAWNIDESRGLHRRHGAHEETLFRLVQRDRRSLRMHRSGNKGNRPL